MTTLYTLTVQDKTVWSSNLFSFRTTRPDGFRFQAGQFVRLGLNPSQLTANKGKAVNDELIFRAYSVVSSPYDDFLEFFSVVVPDGAFTSQLQYLQVGDTLSLEATPYGFLTLSRYQKPSPNDLWLLATGTGVAPFLSILQDLNVWQSYRHIVLAYSVRTQSELAYQDEIEQIAEQFEKLTDNPASFVFVPIITRQKTADVLGERLPKLLQQGLLEKEAGLLLNPDTSHIMLCGNPQMVEDTKEALKAMGFSMNRRGVGNIAVENYW